MHRADPDSVLETINQKLRAARETWQTRSVKHPIRASLPFLGLSGLLLSAAVLASTCTVCYTVNAQGQTVSYFQGAGTYQAAVAQAENRTSRILDTDYSFTEDVTLRTTLAPKKELEELPQVTDSIMEIIPELEHVYTLTVDGVRVGAAESDQVIQEALTLVKDHYTTPATLSIQVTSQVTPRYEYLPAETGTLTARELADRLLEAVPQTFPYTVQDGDTLEALLDHFGMTLERLQELNPEADLESQVTAMGMELSDLAAETASDGTGSDMTDLAEIWAAEFGTPLEAGTVLTIEQVCPRLIVTTVEEQKFDRVVAPTLETQPDATMFAGEQRIIQDGVPGQEAVLARVVKRCGVSIASTDLGAVTTTEATPLIVGTGTQPKPQLPDGCLFLWPVRGPITSDYGYRFIFGETNFHRGIDIAAPSGTAINAAADGVVTFAGVRGTYGNLVVVSHQNGFVTYYAHCSRLLVNVGDTVTQGQPVAAVGSTGRSTGPHLHFEVRYQNNPIDPLLYLPGENNAPAREEIPEVEEAPEETTGETPEQETPPEDVTPEDTTPAEPLPTPPAESGESETPAEPAPPAELPVEPPALPEGESPVENPAAPPEETPAPEAEEPTL